MKRYRFHRKDFSIHKDAVNGKLFHLCFVDGDVKQPPHTVTVERLPQVLHSSVQLPLPARPNRTLLLLICLCTFEIAVH